MGAAHQVAITGITGQPSFRGMWWRTGGLHSSILKFIFSRDHIPRPKEKRMTEIEGYKEMGREKDREREKAMSINVSFTIVPHYPLVKYKNINVKKI